MSKNKNDKNTSLDFETIATHVGLAACSLAALAGLVELHTEQRQPRLVNQMQPAYAHTEPADQEGHHLDMRKEREEIKHATISFGVTMRSHPIAGKA